MNLVILNRSIRLSVVLVLALGLLTIAAAEEIYILPGQEVSVTSTDGTAVAIETNGGDDVVTNQGTVSTEARDQETTTATAIRTGRGNDRVTNAGFTDATARATGRSAAASATGIEAGADDDVVINELGLDQLVTVDARSTGTPGLLVIVPGADASSTADAAATGIEAGIGEDNVFSADSIDVRALALSGAGKITIPIGSGGNAGSTAGAVATGIDGGGGADFLLNQGLLNVGAEAHAGSGEIDVGAAADARADALSAATVTARGAVAGDGVDEVRNDAELVVRASASAGSGEISIKGDAGAAGDVSCEAGARAFGVEGFLDADEITNSDRIRVEASANAGTGSLSVDFAGDANGNASTSATAEAIGIAGGDDSDTLIGLVGSSVVSTATATSGSGAVSVALDGSVGGDVSSTATATAKGMDGQGGADIVENNGGMVEALATAISGSGTIGVGVATDADADAMGSAEGDANSTATATALGLAGSTVTNSGTLTVGATATTGAGSVEVNVDGDATGDAKTFSEAMATGVAGTSGVDALRNLDLIQATAMATSIDGSTVVATNGNAKGDVSSTATATAKGMDGQGGADTVENNEGMVEALATAISGSGTIGVAVKTDDGDDGDSGVAVTAGAQSAEGSVTSDATAIASGIDGAGVVNTGNVSAQAKATTGAGNVEIDTSGKAKADAATKAVAIATGIRGAAGGARVREGNVITATADALAGSASVGVGVGGSVAGDVTSTAEATAEGVVADTRGGAVDNGAFIEARATAASGAGTLKVSTPPAGGSSTPAAGELTSEQTSNTADASSDSLLDKLLAKLEKYVSNVKGTAAAESKASATGLTGSTKDDTITSSNDVEAIADAKAVAANVSVNVTKIEQTVGAAASLVSVGATADSNATALDAGGGDDDLTQTGKVTSSANSGAFAIGWTVDVEGSPKPPEEPEKTKIEVEATKVVVDAALVDATVNSSAVARGVTGGEGANDLHNEKSITSKANADAGGIAASLSVSNLKDASGGSAALSKSSVTAQASSTGVVAGEGSSSSANAAEIRNRGDVDSKANAFAGGISASVDVVVSGKNVAVDAALSESDVDATATSSTIQGSTGSDDIRQEGYVDSQADATAGAVSLSVGVSVAKENSLAASTALTDATGSAEAIASGITSGAGDDVVFQPAPGASGGGDPEGIRAHATANGVAAAAAIGVAYEGKSGAALSGALADASSVSRASAVGIDVGVGDDRVVREAPGPGGLEAGAIDVSAKANGDAVSIGVDFGGTGENGFAGGATLTRATTTATSEGVGIAAGEGLDEVTNEGDIKVQSTSEVLAGSVSLDVKSTNKGASVGAALSDTRALAETTGSGILAGGGDDYIKQRGDITLDSTAKSVAVSGSVAFQGTSEGLTGGAALSRSDGTANASSLGVDGGAGNDTIEQEGSISTTVDAGVVGVSGAAEAAVESKGFATGVSFSDASGEANSLAQGILGGDGDDGLSIADSGDIDHPAIDLTSTASATTASFSFELSGTSTGVSGGAALADASAKANAGALGASGGEGRDEIANAGSIKNYTVATATAVSLSGQLGVTNEGVALGVSLADTSAATKSDATGIEGGSGDDIVNEDGDVTVNAVAHTNAVAAGVNVQGAAEGGGVGVALSLATGTADASAMGLDGGVGDDLLIETGKTSATAESTVVALSGSAVLSFSGEGAALSASLSDAKSIANSVAGSSSGGVGDDEITHSGDATVSSKAIADSAAVSVTLAGAAEGFAAGASLADTSAKANAQAFGSAGGEGRDVIANTGSINVTSSANADAISASGDLTIAGEGVALGVALADTSAESTSETTGIAGGEGDDEIGIKDDGDLSATAMAHTETGAVSVNVQGTAGGLAGGAALSKSTGTADASMIGIDGGEGDDQLTHSGNIHAEAKSEVVAVSASGDVAFAGEAGAALGASLSNASTLSQSLAVGIAGGEGDDVIALNQVGAIDLISSASADTVTVSVTVAGTVAGLAGGASLADVSATADARAIGSYGGAGADTIDSSGSIIFEDVSADADAMSVDVSLTVAGEGEAIDFSLANSAAVAAASATGVSGGDGTDALTNTGDVVFKRVNSDAEVLSSTVSLSGGEGGVGLGVSLVDGSATSRTHATGLTGGDGDDVIRNSGNIVAPMADAKSPAAISAHAQARAASLQVSVEGEGVSGGVALAQSGTKATTTAAGIDGGTGDDEILNEGVINLVATSTADAEVDGLSLDVTVVGAALSVTAADANAVADTWLTGIDGGDGDEVISNTGSVEVAASTDAKAAVKVANVDIAIGGVGGALARATSTAKGDATAIAGGDGEDLIENDGETLSASSDSAATGTALSLAAGVAAAAMGETTSSSTATSAAIRGDGDDDMIFNRAKIDSRATATAEGLSLSASVGALANVNLADASTEALGIATGISGGDKMDLIENDGEARAESVSKATGTALSLGMGLLGVESAKTTSSSTATSAAIRGDGDDDMIFNRAKIDSRATATADGLSVGGSVALAGGVTLAEASTEALGTATGISAGDGKDLIENSGETLTADSTSAARGTALSANITMGAGFSLGRTTSTSTATSVAISGGADDDAIRNRATIHSNSTATAEGLSGSLNLGLGGSLGDASTAAHSSSIGISGGTGNDHIAHGDTGFLPSIEAHSEAEAQAKAGSLNVAGASLVNTSSDASAIATGIAGDSGGDSIEVANDTTQDLAAAGKVSASAKAVGDSRSAALELQGFQSADAAATSVAAATGIDGGDDGDVIAIANVFDDAAANTAEVVAAANATGTAGGVTLTGEGIATADASTTVRAIATGVGGGNGDDEIDLGIQGLVTADATATGNVAIRKLDIADYGNSTADTEVEVQAQGLDGGDGSDSVTNAGFVDVASNSTSDIARRTFSVVGRTRSSADTFTRATSKGINGGGGEDELTNLATINASADAHSTVEGASWSFAGGAADDVKISSSAEAFGLAGGAGNDKIRNEGDVTAASEAVLRATSDSEVFIGVSSGAEISAEVEAAGIDGGSEDDVIENAGRLRIVSTARLYSEEVRASFVGVSSTEELLQSESRAAGLSGGEGVDDIKNSGEITVEATSYARSVGGASASFAGNPEVAGVIATTVDAVGIEADSIPAGEGGGARVEMGPNPGAGDTVANSGSLLVSADVELLGTHNSSSGFFSAGGAAKTRVQADVNADGVRAAGGRVDLVNSERIHVSTATSDGELNDPQPGEAALPEAILARSTAAGGDLSLGGNAEAEASAAAVIELSGVEAGDGDSRVVNAAGASLFVETAEDVGFRVIASTTSKASTVNEGSDAIGTSAASVESTLSGIRTGDGDSTLMNEVGSTLTVTARPSVKASTDAKGGTVGAGSDGAATTAAAVEVSSSGIWTGNGASSIVNGGAMSVTAAPVAESLGAAAATLGSAERNSTANANGVEAIGIRTGAGSSMIANIGEMSVTAMPVANSKGEAKVSTSGSGKHNSTALADSVQAVGIQTGDGASSIENFGSLTVTSHPHADATANAEGASFGAATAIATASANDALAVAIQTGGGEGHAVLNAGDLVSLVVPKVTANVSRQAGSFCPYKCGDKLEISEANNARAFGILTGDGSDYVENTGSISARVEGDAALTGSGAATAIGIDTGGGNDVVINDGLGSIAASFAATGTVPVAVAIRTGAGDDQVALRGQSTVTGLIDLGAEHDHLTLAGEATITGDVHAGDGIDTVQIEDQGHFFLNRIDANENFFVDQGTLEVGTETGVLVNGSFRAEIFNGGNGLLELPGTAQLSNNPQAEVVVRPRAFRDGDAFDLLTAMDIVGEFDVNLPPDSALVSFSSQIRRDFAARDAFEVSTAVEPFSSLARNRVQRAVAGYLEEITPTAAGDLSEVVGTFQLLPADADFDTAFTSLSPDTHDSYTVANYYGFSLYHDVLNRRMQAMHVGDLFIGTLEQAGRSGAARTPILITDNDAGNNAGSIRPYDAITTPAWWRDVWGTAFGGWGDQDGDDGYTGFDYNVAGFALGIDQYVSDRLQIGASAAYSSTDVDQNNQRGSGDIDGWMASIYSSYSTDRDYVDGSISYGRNSYKAERKVRIGGLTRTAKSDHDGQVISAMLGTGIRTPVNNNILETFGRLQYTRLDEDAFTESGAGDINQKISSRDTASLTSEIGMRVSRIVSKESGRLKADASVAWLHDFDIDDRIITTGYTGSPDVAFSLPGQDTEQNGLTMGLGLSFENKKGMTTSLSYQGEFRDGFSAHGVMGRVMIRF